MYHTIVGMSQTLRKLMVEDGKVNEYTIKLAKTIHLLDDLSDYFTPYVEDRDIIKKWLRTYDTERV